MTSGSRDSRFSDKEFQVFVEACVKDEWTASRDADELHDVSITHPDKNREILIDTQRKRVSYRNTDSEKWGLQQKPVSDLEGAVTKLQTVALFVPMNEMHYLGLGAHPDPPDDHQM